jgi:hypothetical protein
MPYTESVRGLATFCAFAEVRPKPTDNLSTRAIPEGNRQTVAVGTLVTQRPPHRSARAAFLHAALTAEIWRRSAYQDTDEEAWGAGASA